MIESCPLYDTHKDKLGNGICDFVLNNQACLYDKGDCQIHKTTTTPPTTTPMTTTTTAPTTTTPDEGLKLKSKLRLVFSTFCL